MKPRFLLLSLALMGLTASCVTAQPTSNSVRVMTYNIYWLGAEQNPERIANINAIFRQTRPDIVGFQETASRAAAAQVFPSGEWTVGMLDDPREHQELGIAVRKPHRLVKHEMLFPGPAVDFAFPGARDVLRAEIETAAGKKLVVYVVHSKSRRGSEATPRGFSGRKETDVQRELAAGMLAGWLAGWPKENSVVLGDFNDTPDDRSLNILESGNILAQGGQAGSSNALLTNLTEPLYREDWVSLDLDRRFVGEPIEARVPGAMASNEEWRGKEHRFPDDLKVSQTLFDQILIRTNSGLKPVGRAQIFSGAEALRGSDTRVRVDSTTRVPTFTEKGSKASDHLPVFVDLEIQ